MKKEIFSELKKWISDKGNTGYIENTYNPYFSVDNNFLNEEFAIQQSKEESELSEDEEEEKLTFVDRVKMGLGSIGFMNTALLGSLGTSLIEKITNYVNIDTSSSAETAISFAIGIVLLLVGNTVYDKLKRIKKF